VTVWFAGEPVLVIGGGSLAEAIATGLAAEGAAAVVAPEAPADSGPLAAVAIVVEPDGRSGASAAATMLQTVADAIDAVRGPLAGSGRGAIVIVAPGLGSEHVLGPAGFAAATGGLAAAARGWAVELGDAGVRVNAVQPGLLVTDPDLARRTPGRDIGYVPLRRSGGARLGTPSDVAAAVAFLLSEDARYVTGALLHVDGAAGQSRNSAAFARWDAGLDS
jgi:hypothetical protein